MKKFALIGLALCVAFMFAAPAMALDVDFSGFYRVRGFSYHNYNTFGNEDNSGGFNEHASNYLDMLLDVNIVFKVHPKLKLVTNFTALDKVWGEGDIQQETIGLSDNPAARKEDTNNIDWNQAYMEFVTGVGVFRVGRMTGGAYQHPFLNTSYDTDRFMWIMLPKSMGGPGWNPLLLVYVYEKFTEADSGIILSDQDTDYHLFVTDYISSNFTVGHLFGFVRDETPLSTAAALNDVKADTYFTNPYAKVKIGPVMVEAEARYTWGYITDLGNNTATERDVEISTWSWFTQATFDGGPFDVYAGWAHTDGDKDGGQDPFQPKDQTLNSQSGQMGDDWDLLFFLTSDEGSHAATFGGIGNWSSAGNNPYGLDLLYLGGGFDITPDITLSGVWGLARADAVPNGSKKIGHEFNFWLTWQIMDGLQYKALFAYFDAGDFWEDTRSYPSQATVFGPGYGKRYSAYADNGSAWALFHQLTLSF